MFTLEKILETILYIAAKKNDLYAILKIIYFANKVHLKDYGRFLTDEDFKAMQYGPVPSTSYDVIKCGRNMENDFTACLYNSDEIKKSFQVIGNNVVPNREANLDYLSETEVEALDKAILKYSDHDFDALGEISHDTVYSAAYNKKRNSRIRKIDIVTNINDPDLTEHYILHNGAIA